jgi:hypothetical protein
MWAMTASRSRSPRTKAGDVTGDRVGGSRTWRSRIRFPLLKGGFAANGSGATRVAPAIYGRLTA